MIQISLKKLLAKETVAAIVKSTINVLEKPIAILDHSSRLLLGEISEKHTFLYPIEVAQEVIGAVRGSENAVLVASLLVHLATQEIEKKTLTSELLDKYREISLLYNLSEELSGSLDIQTVARLVFEEAQKLIKATDASLILLNRDTKHLDIVFTLGTRYKPQTSIKSEEGIVGSVVHTGRAEIVNDVLSDPRYVNRETQISSLICAPLKIRNEVIGAIELSSKQFAEYTSEDLKLLTTLASQAAAAIENAIRHKNQIKEAIARSELQKGQQMQKDFLPERLPEIPGWNLAVVFAPARQVAGDFYDAFLLPNNHLGLVIADVCDKGVGSALFMALFRSLIRIFSGQTYLSSDCHHPQESNTHRNFDYQHLASNYDTSNPLKAVEMTNNYVAQNHSNLNMFATLFFGILDINTGLFNYVNGGHESLLVIDTKGVKQRLKPTGPAVGFMPNMKFKMEQIHLEAGDILFGYTDGVPEARNPQGDFFTENKLLSILDRPALKFNKLLEEIQGNLIAHIDEADQFDDITMLAVHREYLTNE
ncbi:GAF domain-containing SpoIIE family protein phosphatase [Nostoc sp. 106C]|uniref:PP2C family protein-serine/threonine phosphatase n=1 Tax=Nostoc sp. 106C TaxID=1932667 RepID=UPI000A3A49B7|nr:GAF domain-containing SpoIIE family protein phosphatase [Nostoc sp. 106C]OUL26189.1 serine/threonine protein phosphatase [Nostoc sp. 106C]